MLRENSNLRIYQEKDEASLADLEGGFDHFFSTFDSLLWHHCQGGLVIIGHHGWKMSVICFGVCWEEILLKKN